MAAYASRRGPLWIDERQASTPYLIRDTDWSSCTTSKALSRLSWPSRVLDLPPPILTIDH